MKYLSKSLYALFLLMFALSGCDLTDSDDDGDEFTGNVETYELQSTDNSDVSGTVIFEEFTDGTTLVTLELDGTEGGAGHPAHIHANSVAEGGGIDIPLNPVDGSTGMSETEVDSKEDGTSITYQELTDYDGHVNVHLSENDLSTIIARGDIGGNGFTGQSVTYELHETDELIGSSGVSGEIRLEERNNGNTLATIEVTGTNEEGDHPAHIHENSVEEGGGVSVPLNHVDGESGLSMTNIRASETPGNLTYSDLLEYDGHVNVHVSDDDLTVISEGNIGENYEE